MTGNFSKNIMADSLTGMIFAAEGVKGAVTLLNGPMGCKFYHSTTSRFLSIRPLMLVPGANGERVGVDYNYLNNYFFRQERVPCTYLDGYDYVYGTSAKVKEALIYLRDNISFDVLFIVNSPGASLIGDHLEELARDILPQKSCVILESPGFSESFDEGYEYAALEILKQLMPSRESDTVSSDFKHLTAPEAKGGCSVNILGLSIYDRYNSGDLEELKRLLDMCSISVNCALCSNCTPEEIKKIPDADLNLVINSRAGNLCAQYLKENYGMESLICECLPIGFEETEELFKELCERPGCDAGSVLKESEDARALAWYKINDTFQMYGKPDGALFAIEGSFAVCAGFCRFLSDYLGMNADAVSITGAVSLSQKELLEELKEKYRLEEALRKDIYDTDAELVFADANTIAALSLRKTPFCGIEISLPGMGYTDLLPKTYLGIRGCLFLIEQVLNGLMEKL